MDRAGSLWQFKEHGDSRQHDEQENPQRWNSRGVRAQPAVCGRIHLRQLARFPAGDGPRFNNAVARNRCRTEGNSGEISKASLDDDNKILL